RGRVLASRCRSQPCSHWSAWWPCAANRSGRSASPTTDDRLDDRLDDRPADRAPRPHPMARAVSRDGTSPLEKAAAEIDARAQQYGYDHPTRGAGLNPTEQNLVTQVKEAPKVLAGRSVNIEGQGSFTLDNFLTTTDTPWSPRMQEVYNFGLYDRAASGQPV